jgi:hypothetical protein
MASEIAYPSTDSRLILHKVERCRWEFARVPAGHGPFQVSSMVIASNALARATPLTAFSAHSVLGSRKYPHRRSAPCAELDSVSTQSRSDCPKRPNQPVGGARTQGWSDSEGLSCVDATAVRSHPGRNLPGTTHRGRRRELFPKTAVESRPPFVTRAGGLAPVASNRYVGTLYDVSPRALSPPRTWTSRCI